MLSQDGCSNRLRLVNRVPRPESRVPNPESRLPAVAGRQAVWRRREPLVNPVVAARARAGFHRRQEYHERSLDAVAQSNQRIAEFRLRVEAPNL